MSAKSVTSAKEVMYCPPFVCTVCLSVCFFVSLLAILRTVTSWSATADSECASNVAIVWHTVWKQACNCGVFVRPQVRKVRYLANENLHSNRIGGLGATYAVHLWLIGKLVGDFIIGHNWTFFARCFHFVTIHTFDRQADGQNFYSKVRSNEVRGAHKFEVLLFVQCSVNVIWHWWLECQDVVLNIQFVPWYGAAEADGTEASRVSG